MKCVSDWEDLINVLVKITQLCTKMRVSDYTDILNVLDIYTYFCDKMRFSHADLLN
jgi:hypothetical protein